ncbi:MAG: 50S ribosomal protein L4 [Nevskiaceae bacterium]|nr:MAG: 50S ribosomal protein L4 [Nevskiaceae bacterium]TBR72950.1 MAG: 50S ribosomal protein L4 [Nevskiaceae bacterium]
MEMKMQAGAGSISLADGVFGVAYNEALVHQVVVAYQAAGRAGTKAQKTKGEVSGGGKKPWKQKGTGRARAGSIRSPLWRGGGVTFAAKPRDFTQKVNRKMYRGAMRSIISELARRELLLVAESLQVAEPKTQKLIGQLGAMEVRNVLVVTDSFDRNLYLAARNAQGISVCDVEGLNPVALLSHEQVLVTSGAVKKLEAWLS